MPKAASPIRLDKALMDEASLASSTLHRSTAEQVEYWADIGRKVAKLVDPEVLLQVKAGLATLLVEKTPPIHIDPDTVFAKLDNARDTGVLSDAIAADRVRFQASTNHPGKLEAVYPSGKTEVGAFIEGKFKAEKTL